MLVHQLANVDVTTKSRHWSRNTIQPAHVVSYDNSYNIVLRAQVKALEKRMDNLKVANPPSASIYTCAWCGICDNLYTSKPMTME